MSVVDSRADFDVVGEWRRDSRGKWAVLLPASVVVGKLGQPNRPNPTVLVRKRRGGADLVTVWSHGAVFYAPERGVEMAFCYPSARMAA